MPHRTIQTLNFELEEKTEIKYIKFSFKSQVLVFSIFLLYIMTVWDFPVMLIIYWISERFRDVTRTHEMQLNFDTNHFDQVRSETILASINILWRKLFVLISE